MASLFASGRIVDLILAAVAVEAVLLAGLRYRFGAGPALPGLLANLAAGSALMLALRAALTGSAWPVVAAFMLAGLLAHGIDLALRFRGGERGRFAACIPRQEPGLEPPRSRAVTSS